MENPAKPRIQNPLGIRLFAQRLRALRRHKKLSQQALADLANIERSTVSRMELGLLVASLDTLISLSKGLGIELSELVNEPAITTSDKVN